MQRGRAVERLIFGTDDEAEVLQRVDRFCRDHLDSPVAVPVFAETSVGVVRGVALEDGRRVVVKAHQPARPRDFLEAVHRVQSALHARGFPCPRPLVGPRPLGEGLATVEELVDEGRHEDAHRPAVRRAMAELLASQLATVRRVGDEPALAHSWRIFTPAGMWPEPHSPIFDFETTRRGAEWIDELAAAHWPAAARAAESEPLAGHTDWSAEHFRFVDGRVRVVYDWDSLALASEPHVLGVASATFPADPAAGVTLAPAPDESRAFVDDYSAARHRPLSRAERAGTAAVTAVVVAYVARCEHALGRDGDFTAALRRHGADYAVAG